MPYWEENLDLDLRNGAKSASRIGQFIGRSIGTDPRNVEHLLSSMLGDYGRLAVNASSIGVEGSNTTLADTAMRFSGSVRKQSPWSLTDAQATMDRHAKLGMGATKQAKSFREMLKMADAQGTPLKNIFGEIEKARADVEKISVEQRKQELAKKKKKLPWER